MLELIAPHVVAYAGFACLAAALVTILRRLTISYVKRQPSGTKLATGTNLPAGTTAVAVPVNLRPAELAYLVRSGDMTHTVIVVAVDLCQRYLKRGEPGDEVELELAPYEREAASGVKIFLRAWAKDKVDGMTGKHMPAGDKGRLTLDSLRGVWRNPLFNPLETMWQLRALKRFITGPVAQVLHDIIKDPRQLRKYFHPAGIARLVVDLYSRGVKTAIEQSMLTGLIGAGLLVTRERRQRGANFMIVLFVAALGLFAALAWRWLGGHLGLFIFAGIAGFFNALLLWVKLAIPSFLPAFEEFALVLKDLDRQGVRIRAARALLNGLKGFFAFTTILMLVILFGVDVILGSALGRLPLGDLVTAIAVATVSMFTLANVLAAWYKLTFQEETTAAGDAAIDARKKAVAALSPLSHLKKAFAEPDYDPTFSELVAIYGVETLWLLS